MLGSASMDFNPKWRRKSPVVAYRNGRPALSLRPAMGTTRGVDSPASLDTLVEKRFVRIAGRKDSPGRPFLYATTGDFLRHFGLKSIEALPSMALPTVQEPEAAIVPSDAQ